jgi:hypothetical protein
MNELFEPGDPPPERVPGPPRIVDYDDELETIDPAYRYVLKRPSEPSADS